MSISDPRGAGPDDVRRMARLARLHLAEGEAEQLSQDLLRMLDYVDRLPDPAAGSDAQGESAMPLRDDAVTEGLSREDALREAPEISPPFFRVPPVMGKD